MVVGLVRAFERELHEDVIAIAGAILIVRLFSCDPQCPACPAPMPNSGRIEAPCAGAGAADSNQGFCPRAGTLVSPREQN
jgi:hypothetical protein